MDIPFFRKKTQAELDGELSDVMHSLFDAYHGDSEMFDDLFGKAEKLVSKGANIDQGEGRFLYYALEALNPRSDLVRSILKLGSDANQIISGNSFTPLLMCVKENYRHHIPVLLEFGADVLKKNAMFETPFDMARRLRNEAMTEILFQPTLEALSKDRPADAKQAIREAMQDEIRRDKEEAKRIREEKEREAQRQKEEKEREAQRVREEREREEARKRAEREKRDAEERARRELAERDSRLRQACYDDRPKDALLLLEKGANPYAYNADNGRNAITAACNNSALRSLKALFDEGVDFTREDGSGRTYKNYSVAQHIDSWMDIKQQRLENQKLLNEIKALRQAFLESKGLSGRKIPKREETLARKRGLGM